MHRVFRALPKVKRMALSRPNWATLAVLGVNSFTERHSDKNDIKCGLATLVALGDYKGGDLCFPQLGIRIAYQPGTCAMFRGAELEHFVADWEGYRVFLLFTNHQAVRNWADPRMGKIPPLEGDSLHKEQDQAQEDDDLDDVYDPCVEEGVEFSDSEEELSNQGLHGPAWWSPSKNLTSGSSGSSDSRSEVGSAKMNSVALSHEEPSPSMKRKVESDG